MTENKSTSMNEADDNYYQAWMLWAKYLGQRMAQDFERTGAITPNEMLEDAMREAAASASEEIEDDEPSETEDDHDS